MRKGLIALAVAAALSSYSQSAVALECVPYARQISGLELRGDAWTWWANAAGQYDRGQAPRPGAVLVFKKHGSMNRGHVAVVTKVIARDEILIDHANWAPYRGRVYRSVRVRDVSPAGDWTKVRVWYDGVADFGNTAYPTHGFIYQPKNRIWPASLADALPPPRAEVIEEVAALPAKPEPVKVEVAKAEPVKVEPVAKVEPKQEAAPVVIATAVHTVAKAPPVKVDEPKKADRKGETKIAEAMPPKAEHRLEAPKTDDVWSGDQEAARLAGSGSYGLAR